MRTVLLRGYRTEYQRYGTGTSAPPSAAHRWKAVGAIKLILCCSLHFFRNPEHDGHRVHQPIQMEALTKEPDEELSSNKPFRAMPVFNSDPGRAGLSLYVGLLIVLRAVCIQDVGQ